MIATGPKGSFILLSQGFEDLRSFKWSTILYILGVELEIAAICGIAFSSTDVNDTVCESFIFGVVISWILWVFTLLRVEGLVD